MLLSVFVWIYAYWVHTQLRVRMPWGIYRYKDTKFQMNWTYICVRVCVCVGVDSSEYICQPLSDFRCAIYRSARSLHCGSSCAGGHLYKWCCMASQPQKIKPQTELVSSFSSADILCGIHIHTNIYSPCFRLPSYTVIICGYDPMQRHSNESICLCKLTVNLWSVAGMCIH